MGSNAGLATILITLAIFATVAVRYSGRAQTVATYFHLRNTRVNLASLIVSNITVGSGLAYLLTAGQLNGIAMVAAPFGLLLGYWLLQKLTVRIPRAYAEQSSFFGAVAANITAQTGHRSLLQEFFLAPLVLIFLLLFAYEIFVTSQVLAGLASVGDTVLWPKLIAVALFGASLFYCYVAGAQAVMRTDVLQLATVALFLMCLVIVVVAAPEGSGDAASPAARWDGQIALNVAAAFVASLATQLYSLINWFVLSNLPEAGARRRVVGGAAVVSAVVFTLLILLGALAPLDWSAGLVSAMQSLRASLPAPWDAVFAVIALVGLTAIVISTIDTLMIALLMYATHWRQRPVGEQEELACKTSLGRLRVFLLLMFGSAFLFLAVLFYTQPNIFYLLLSIGSGAAVFAPAIILLCVVVRKPPEVLAALTNAVLAVFPLLFVLAFALSQWAAQAYPTMVPWVMISHAIIASIYAVGVYGRVRRFAASQQTR